MSDFDKLLEDIKELTKSSDPEILSVGLNSAIELIEQLDDERNSLWLMLDEMKASEIKNYSDEFEKMIDKRLAHIKLLARLKPDVV